MLTIAVGGAGTEGEEPFGCRVCVVNVVGDGLLSRDVVIKALEDGEDGVNSVGSTNRTDRSRTSLNTS